MDGGLVGRKGVENDFSNGKDRDGRGTMDGECFEC